MLRGGAFYRGNRDLFIVITKVRLPVSLSLSLYLKVYRLELERVIARKKVQDIR